MSVEFQNMYNFCTWKLVMKTQLPAIVHTY